MVTPYRRLGDLSVYRSSKKYRNSLLSQELLVEDLKEALPTLSRGHCNVKYSGDHRRDYFGIEYEDHLSFQVDIESYGHSILIRVFSSIGPASDSGNPDIFYLSMNRYYVSTVTRMIMSLVENTILG